ncbi:MAG: NAD(P)-dependent oxidoreductase [Euryarchaeota archaeon]|nr:NAD(P)-dependent oxidoreductase [Euryarchaeota archaeon]|tara:strand:- start:3920 stop:4669 length:750 start_codon:yes stop_codon:yes gene_type:complete
MKKIAFITGATSGIGYSISKVLAKDYALILCGRRESRLNKIENELSKLTDIYTLCYDIRDNKNITKSFNSLPNKWKKIYILINNAGNAHGMDLIHEGDVSDWDAMIDINVKGLLYVSKLIIPIMTKSNKGIIINIGSIAGKEIYPKGNVYCASKYAVDAITKAMQVDLNKFNIKVSSVNPGLVETEFALVRFKGDKEKANLVYDGIKPLTPDDVAEVIYFIINRPDNVNISDITIFPKNQASSTVINRE